ncbi:hypothetical protein BDW68DRAFT_55721 [Aspergillus falconensis]
MSECLGPLQLLLYTVQSCDPLSLFQGPPISRFPIPWICLDTNYGRRVVGLRKDHPVQSPTFLRQNSTNAPRELMTERRHARRRFYEDTQGWEVQRFLRPDQISPPNPGVSGQAPGPARRADQGALPRATLMKEATRAPREQKAPDSKKVCASLTRWRTGMSDLSKTGIQCEFSRNCIPWWTFRQS